MDSIILTIMLASDERTVAVSEGATVLDAIRQAGLSFQAPCGGLGTCGKCGVRILSEAGIVHRLACQTTAEEGMLVSLPETGAMLIESSGDGEESGGWAACGDGRDACAVGAAAGGGAFGTGGGVGGASGGGTGGCGAGRAAKDVGGRLGVAVDLGTTTLALRLLDLETGAMLATVTGVNPQAAFGADVISRIDASMAGSLQQMHSVITGAIGQMASRACREAGASIQQIAKAVVAGNTVMEHILCGLAPDSIGVSPFEPLTRFGSTHELEGSGLPVPAFVADCISGYVGGDVACGILATRMLEAEEPVLLIDLGTNGEIALAGPHGLSCCATAAGPVFEGATLRFGMPALPGAVCAVHDGGGRRQDGGSCGHGSGSQGSGSHGGEDGGRSQEASGGCGIGGSGGGSGGGLPTLEVIGGGKAQGFCGTGIVDMAAWLLRHGVVDATGMMLSADALAEPYRSQLGTLGGQRAFFPVPGNSLAVTQEDIRNIQLGKGAVAAGTRVLLSDAGLAMQDVGSLLIAGGFGRKLNPASAAQIGLIPRELLACAKAVGNSSLDGATMAALSADKLRELGMLARESRYIELSTDKRFNEAFMEQMMLG